MEPPVSLPFRRDLLRQPHFHRFHLQLHVLQLHGWRLWSSLQVGVSRQVAQQLAQCHRASSQRLYQHRWKCYRQWYASKGHTVSVPSIAKIADFLFFLRKEKGLAVSSVKGFRSMLSSVFKFRVLEIQDSFILKDLLRSFELERPPRSPSPPSWDLAKVLSFLRDSRFEPLSSCVFH